MNAIQGRVTKSGRISLPAEFRKAVGLDGGGEVVVELDGKEIRIRTVNEVVAVAQARTRSLLKAKPDSSVDAFLELRRREAVQE